MQEPRAGVHRASTYRVRERLLLCAACGEEIREWQAFAEERDPAWGDIPLPVHADCSDPGNGEEPGGGS